MQLNVPSSKRWRWFGLGGLRRLPRPLKRQGTFFALLQLQYPLQLLLLHRVSLGRIEVLIKCLLLFEKSRAAVSVAPELAQEVRRRREGG